MSTTPEALRLAAVLTRADAVATQLTNRQQAAAELRRLAGEVQRLQFEQQNSHEAWVALSDHAGKLRAEVEALRADAERYRWLREQGGLREDYRHENFAMVNSLASDIGGEVLDMAIDAARKA